MTNWLTKNRGIKFLALAIAALMWAAAHGTKPVEKGFDVPLVFRNVPEAVVITDQNTDVVNVRIKGSRAALRNIDENQLEYAVDVSGAQVGDADFEVDETRIAVPRGAEIVSRSPLQIEVKFERRGTKVMRVRADLEGEPAAGYLVKSIEVEPPRVRVTGARREVFRLSEVVTEPIDITGISESAEREVRLSLGGRHVWVEESKPVKIRVQVEAVAAPEAEEAKG